MSLSILLLLAFVVISLLAFNKHELLEKLAFNPYLIQKDKDYYRFVSHAFVHADSTHLFFNGFSLFFFGPAVEQYYSIHFGSNAGLFFCLLYFGGIIAAAIPSYFKHRSKKNYTAVGASGAISSVIFSFIVFNPLQDLCVFFAFCLPGIILGIIYLGYSYYAGKKGDSLINHDAHLAGALFGILFTLLMKPSLLQLFTQQLSNWNQ